MVTEEAGGTLETAAPLELEGFPRNCACKGAKHLSLEWSMGRPLDHFRRALDEGAARGRASDDHRGRY